MFLEKLHIRYAQAYYQLARKEGQMGKVMRDVYAILEACKAAPSFVPFLRHPGLRPAQKQRILAKALEKLVCPLTFTFIAFLVSKRREAHLQGILRQLEALYKADEHIHTAYLTTVRPLSAALRSALVEHVQKLLAVKDRVQLVERLDPDLIGGYVLKIGDQQLDMSIRTQLMRLQAHWARSPLSELNPSTV